MTENQFVFFFFLSQNLAFEVVVHKLLTNSDSLSDEAVKAQVDYASAVRNHTKLLRQAMDDTSDVKLIFFLVDKYFCFCFCTDIMVSVTCLIIRLRSVK